MMKLTTRFASGLLALCASPVVLSTVTQQSVNYTYHPAGTNGAGMVATVDGPRTDVSDVTSYGYDAIGNRISITNPLNQVVQLTDYNGRGLPGKVIDINGVETVLTYHIRGWLLSSTVKDPGGDISKDSIAQYDYDAVGQVIKITLPDSSYLEFEYDGARRLTAIENNLNERIEYTLDNAGNRTKEEIKNAAGTLVKTHSQMFDELSRLMQSIGADNQTHQQGYDKNDNPVQLTDARTHATGQAFDALNRLVKQTDPDGFEVNYTYDAKDRIKTVTDQRGLVTTYHYDAFGNLTQLDSPDTGTTLYTYDAAGNLTQQTDARTVVADYTYDALNRLTTASYPGNPSENVTYTYDDATNGNYGKGRLTGVQYQAGQISLEYDHQGNIVEKAYTINGVAYSVNYEYTTAGQLTKVTYPGGRVVNYSLDAAGRYSGITTQASASASAVTVVNAINYLPYGPISGYDYGNGISHSISYDQDYRITDIESVGTTTVLDLAYQYDPNSNILTLIDQADTTHDQTFQYDKLNRVTQADGSYGTKDYQYDGVGNRTQSTTTENGSTTTDTYTYSSTSNRLNQVDSTDGANASQKTLNYTAAGHLDLETHSDGTVRDFEYNQANRYNSVSIDGAASIQYQYNPFGRRVAKVHPVAANSQHYHYDEQGQLIAITDASGTPVQEYVYLGAEKVAIVDHTSSTATLLSVHNDHLGTPQAVTNDSQQIVWRGRYAPFGKATETTNQITQYARFPGQYYDSETDLHYNYYRDYDPSTGRYIQSDPIGLNGGLNTYGYTYQNPVRWTDPTGEAVPLVWLAGAGVAYLVTAAIVNNSNNTMMSQGNGSGFSDPTSITGSVSGGSAGDPCSMFPGLCQNQGQSQSQCPSPKSTKSWGHTFSRHGAGSKITNRLRGRAAGTGQAQGQWLNNQQAAQHIHNLNLSGNATIRLPPGMGQVIQPNGTIVPARWAAVVLSPNGVRTAYPILLP